MADEQEWVYMRHPAHDPAGPPGHASVAAFHEVWAPKGWVQVDSTTVEASNVLGKPVSDMKSLSKEDLVAYASAKGIPVDHNADKSKIAKAVEDATGSEA